MNTVMNDEHIVSL